MKRSVWISTKTIDDGKTMIVMAHHKTREAAAGFAKDIDNAGWEGPVQSDKYPVGKTWPLTDGAA